MVVVEGQEHGLAAYLMMKEKMTAEQAVNKVKLIRGRNYKTQKTIGHIKGI